MRQRGFVMQWRCYFLAIGFLITSIEVASAADTDVCATMFRGTLQRLSSNRKASIAMEAVARNTCDTSESNYTAGFTSNIKAIIEGVPLVGSTAGNLGITNNKQFCEAYKANKFSFDASDSLLIEPVVEAMAQANYCVALYGSSHVTISHETPSPGEVVFTGQFYTAQGSLRLSVSSDQFQCTSPDPETGKPQKLASDAAIERRRNFNVLCHRAGKQTSNGVDYPLGTVTLATSQGTYIVHVLPDTISDLGTRRAAEDAVRLAGEESERKVRAELLGQIQRSRPVAFAWSDNSHIGFDFFGCDGWNGTSHEQKMSFARDRVCPGGDLRSVRQVFGPIGGGGCGRNGFVAICDAPKKP